MGITFLAGFLTGLLAAAVYFWIGRYIRRQRTSKTLRKWVQRQERGEFREKVTKEANRP